MQASGCEGSCHTGLIPSLHSYTRVNARFALSLCVPADRYVAFTLHEAVSSLAMSSDFGALWRTTPFMVWRMGMAQVCICVQFEQCGFHCGWYSQLLGSILQSRKRALHIMVFFCLICLLRTAISCIVGLVLDLLCCRLSLLLATCISIS